MNELQKVLEADSPEGLETLAVERIKELNNSGADKDKKIDELEKKVKLADEEGTPEDGGKPKEGAKPKEGEEPKTGEKLKEGAGEGKETEKEKALQEKVETLEKENEELKKEAEEKTDAVKVLEESVEKLNKRTDAIGKKQVKPLFHDSDDEIDELKKSRLNIYADSRKVI